MARAHADAVGPFSCLLDLSDLPARRAARHGCTASDDRESGKNTLHPTLVAVVSPPSMISHCPILSRWRRVSQLLPAARAGAPTPIVGQARLPVGIVGISTVETAERLRQPL